MKVTKIACVFVFVISFFQYGNAQIDYKGFPQWRWHKEDSTEYYLYTPKSSEPGRKIPIALFMHGCCGETYRATLRNTVDPPVRMWHNFGANTQAVPTYIISPATSQGWSQHFANLKKVIDDLIANHNGDPQRVYVCGFSMGGEGTFRIIQAYPGFFAAAIPMGMSFKGDSTKVRDIPIWTNQGETDWYARFLRKQVASIRQLNGMAEDTGSTWITGVNPRYSNFKGVGHGVQWDAASTQDLTAWAYSKVNDGNIYPVVYFSKPLYKQNAKKGEKLAVEIIATDADGKIVKLDLYAGNKLVKSFSGSPFKTTIIAGDGDNIIRAIAYDDKGKTSEAVSVVKVNVKPKLLTGELVPMVQGQFYTAKLKGTGNGELRFLSGDNSQLPEGVSLYPDGTIKGFPLVKGNFKTSIVLADEDNETVRKEIMLVVKEKHEKTILVTDAKTKDNNSYTVSMMMIGETPNGNRKQMALTTNPEEINFSSLGKYAGLTYIKTDVNDTARTDPDFLSFMIDQDAIVYVAYEKFDNLLQSTVPAWLNDFTKEEGEIVAQYRYYNVYSKKVKAGQVILPGADAIKNGVTTNYFVMVKPL